MRIVLRFGFLALIVPALFGQAPSRAAPSQPAGDQALVPVSTAAASASLAQPKATPAVTDVEPNAPVVTIQGVCDGAPGIKSPASVRSSVKSAAKPGTRAKATVQGGKDCKTVVTKAEMDAMMDLLLPGATPEQRRGFALNYIRMLAASGVAKEKLLDHDPAVARELEARTEFTRMQVMASSLYRRIETLAQDVQDAEILSYYNQEAGNLIEGEVQRLSLSKLGPRGTQVDLAALRTKAEEYHARAAKGEDLEQMQKEIQAANPGSSAPSMKTATVRRNNLSPEEAIVFNLKPGEITPVVDARGAFEILRLVSVKPIPLETLRADIKTALANGHLQLLMKDATKDVTAKFNLMYLQLPKTPELFLAPSPKPLRAASNGTTGMAPGSRPGAGMAAGAPTGEPVPQPTSAPSPQVAQ
jgi:hypothetical protein